MPQPTEEEILSTIHPESTLVLYTDGSVAPRNPGIGGYALVAFDPGTPYPNISRFTHMGLVDILTCEILAIHEAVKYCISNWNDTSRRIIIFSDNESAIKMIKGFYNCKYEFYYKIHAVRQDILTKMKCVPEIYHMHGHSGYTGNETADREAVYAQRLSQNLNPELLRRLEEVNTQLVRKIKDVHGYTKSYWNERWQYNSIYTDPKAKITCQSLIPTVDVSVILYKKLCKLPKTASKSILRLVCGYCNLRFYQHRWNLGVSSPNCLECDKPETVTHYLLECQKFDDIREKFFVKLKEFYIKSNLPQPVPDSFSLSLILIGTDFLNQYQLPALQALSEYIRLTRVKL